MVREHRLSTTFHSALWDTLSVCGGGSRPDREPPQVREQLWEESDQVRGGGPGLQVQVFQVRSSV